MEFGIELILGICAGGVLSGVAGLLVSLRLLALLQQGNYEGRRFLRWYFKKGNVQRKRISLLALSSVLLSALFCVCFSFLPAWGANLLSALPFFGVFALYLWSEKNYALKVKANRTGRFVRLAAADGVLLVLLFVAAGFGMAAASLAADVRWFYLLRFVPLAALPLALPFVLLAANALSKCFELPRNRRFVRRAGEALSASRCVKIGITGSFGKTSVKQYAAQLLSRKYRVVATPASFNTPMGIARTVKEQGLDCDIFLAEMGARRTGDIRELCELVRPDYGVIVGVCPQHLETFGSLEAIAAEKGVLAEYAKTCVIGRSVPVEGGIKEGRDFSVGEIELTADGCSFTLDGTPVRTGLLGRHAAEDVALAAKLCLLLGMTIEEIAAAAQTLKPVVHRLEKRKANGLTILDDAYNANVEGAKNALEVLSLQPGKKTVVTPGLVELGMLEEEKNAELGASLVGFDVILVGETLVLPVWKGYLDAGGEKERIRIVPTLARAQEILRRELSPGDSVLFLNDLPDVYA